MGDQIALNDNSEWSFVPDEQMRQLNNENGELGNSPASVGEPGELAAVASVNSGALDKVSEVSEKDDSTSSDMDPSAVAYEGLKIATKAVPAKTEPLRNYSESPTNNRKAKPTVSPKRTAQGRNKLPDKLNPEEDLVHQYLQEIGQHPLLEKEDEKRLAIMIEKGNKAAEHLDNHPGLAEKEARKFRRLAREGENARLQFINSNLRLVVSIAKRYQDRGMPLLDLIQEGNLGMMHAVDKFDYQKGFKFSTYATWWIRQAITRGISNTGRTIRLPVHAGDMIIQIHKAQAGLEKAGKPATNAELAKATAISEEQIIALLGHAARTLSLSEPMGQEGEIELGDVLEDRTAQSPLEAAQAAVLPDEVKKALEVLDEREQKIIYLRYGFDRREPRTLEEVGGHFDLTRERIRQIEARALSKLRHPSSGTDKGLL